MNSSDNDSKVLVRSTQPLRARAPGKVVISGAYAVLRGVPALVAAVDRYVTADSARPAEFISAEVKAAFDAPYPAFDASPLRHEDRKLGLGSSAAILAASLAVALGRPDATTSETQWQDALFRRGLRAHREAQGGGSGVDVAASVYGGVLEFQLAGGPGSQPSVIKPVTLPPLVLQLWAADRAAVTSAFVAKVAELERHSKTQFDTLLAQQTKFSIAARDACYSGDASAFITALAGQGRALEALGDAAGIPIVTPELKVLLPLADAENAALLPAGAGGGDIALFAGHAPPSAALLAAAKAQGHFPLTVTFGAQGVHFI